MRGKRPGSAVDASSRGAEERRDARGKGKGWGSASESAH
jgi:hypothetical protein